jgi:hypothetical protein
MKKFILFSTVILFAAGCSGGDGGDGSTGFKVTPGSVTEFTIKAKSYDVIYSGAKSGNYAVVFLGTIDGNSYVGVALSSNPDSSTSFNLKMHFRASAIPASYTLQDSEPTDVITVRNEGSATFSDPATWTGTLDLTFLNNGDGTYTITGVGNPTVGGNPLTITTITALKVP